MFNGAASNVLSVSPSATNLSADENTPATVQMNVDTSLADTYELAVQAPPGWTVTIDSTGQATILPAPGVQGGTYPVQLIARSLTNPALIARANVNVTVNPTQPAVSLTVAPDPVFTVPFGGAQLPSAFQASIQNRGPASDTFALTFPDPPSGFTILNSGTSLTIPAGETAITGLYLLPSGQLPAPGTQVVFTVTATSTTNPAIMQSQTVTFTVPAIHAVTLTSDPGSINTTPGVAASTVITLTNVGNVDESIALASTQSSGLSLVGLSLASLAPGGSLTESISLLPAASTPLNSALSATITATFGSTSSPVTQTLTIPVNVVVPGASAIADAASAANTLGNTDLANRLNDLSTDLTSLVEDPTDAVTLSQALASLDAVTGLLGRDPFLSQLIPTLDADRSRTGGQGNPASGEVQSAVTNLGNALDTVGQTLTDETTVKFTLSLVNNSQVGLPQAPTTYQVVLQNTGTHSTTYDLSVSDLPPKHGQRLFRSRRSPARPRRCHAGRGRARSDSHGDVDIGVRPLAIQLPDQSGRRRST